MQPSIGASACLRRWNRGNRKLRRRAHGKRLHFGALLAGSDPKIALGLKTKPEIRLGAESLGEAQRHIRRDSRFAIQDARKRRPGHSQMARGLSYLPRLEVISENPAGMRGIVHLHGADFLFVAVPGIDENG